MTVSAPKQPPLDRIKTEVRDIAGYHLTAYDCPVKLNQNESPFDVPDELKDEILDTVRGLPWSRYPEPMPADLVAALADYAGVPADHIVVANGSNSLVQHVLSVTVSPGTAIVIPSPSFSLYGQFTNILGGHVVYVDLAADYGFDTDAIRSAVLARNPGVVVLCSPNNPTGSVVDLDDLTALVEESDALFLVDEAYGEFHAESIVDRLDRLPNAIVLKTLSKAFGAAGLRIGYLIAHPEIAAQVLKAKLPFDINVFSRVAALALLSRADLIRERADAICAERDRVHDALGGLEGVTTFPSRANFILFEVDRPNDVFSRLVEQGVLIRNVSGYPRLERGLRVSIGTPEENDRFLGALTTAIGT